MPVFRITSGIEDEHERKLWWAQYPKRQNLLQITLGAIAVHTASPCAGFTTSFQNMAKWGEGSGQKSLKFSSDVWDMAVMLIHSPLAASFACLSSLRNVWLRAWWESNGRSWLKLSLNNELIGSCCLCLSQSVMFGVFWR